MKTDSGREYLMRHGFHMNIVRKEVFVRQIATTSTEIFQGKNEDIISLCWNDYYNESDNNVICSNTNSNADQQNITCRDDNTIIKSKGIPKPPVMRNDDIL
jgi:hypothetical protein